MINKKILVVDDETTLCDTLRFNLELEGYEVDTAYSAEGGSRDGPFGVCACTPLM